MKEIIEQNHEKIVAQWPEAPTGIYSAAMNSRNTNAQILFASIQSAHKRAVELGNFDLLIIDECHLLNSESSETMYSRLIASLREINPALKIVGFTATPYRMKQGLLTEGKNPLFDEIVYETDIQRLIDDGFISPLRSKAGKDKINLDGGVRTRQGDYLTSDMEEAVNKNDVTEKAVAEILQYGQDQMTAEVNVIVIGVDPDKRLPQSHITNGPVDPGNVLKEIIDVAINDLVSGYPTATVFLIREALTFEKFLRRY